MEESHGDDNGDYDKEDDADDDDGGGADGEDDLADTRVPAQKGELEESQE